MDVKPLWKPSDAESSQMSAFIKHVNAEHSRSIESYAQLHSFSVTKISDFWSSVWSFLKIPSSVPYTQVIDESAPMDSIPKWFTGARINYAETMLQNSTSKTALIGCTEDNVLESLSYDQLRMRVGQAALALKSLNVQSGDRVAAYIPNCIEAVIFMLATASIGAIWSSASPDFGINGVLDRFRQIEPKILISTNSVMYNQKIHAHLDKVRQVGKFALISALELPTLTCTIVFSFIEPVTTIDIKGIQNVVLASELLSKIPLIEPIYEQLPFEHPLLIVFSSGTTGKPKCIVHSHGGAMLQHLKEHAIHGSMGPNDIFLYYTTTGWMMWNWLVSGLGTGATIVLYDGSPFKPTPNRLWELVEELNVTHLGVSAKYIQSIEELHVEPSTFNLNSLKMMYSTGSPLKPESYDYIYKHVKKDVCVGSITGGTDIISLFAGHNSAGPVFRGEIQCMCLGMSIEAWDENGKQVFDQPGDLVCTKPFPVMPVYFWNDKNRDLYRNAYFSTFKGVWYHGDYVYFNPKTGGVSMLGRSDGTLNPNGVRFGSAELYNILVEFPQVQDSLAVGQKMGQDERVILFCKMTPGEVLSSDLISKIKNRIKDLLSSRHVPAIILPIADIPYTLTGKKVEVAVKKIISGVKVVTSSSLANPECLDLFYGIRELTVASL